MKYEWRAGTVIEDDDVARFEVAEVVE